MTDRDNSRAERRQARLEEQLRENLKRRKEQARARRGASVIERPEEDAPGEPED